MFVSFLYEISNMRLLLLCSVTFISFGVVGLALASSLLGKKRVWEDSTAISAMSRPIASVFAVLVAFTAIGALNTFNKAASLVQQEAATVNQIHHSVDVLPSEVAQDINSALSGYLSAVINQEWPLMKLGRLDLSARQYLNIIYAHADQYEKYFKNPVHQIAFNEMFRQLNVLFDIHRERAFIATQTLELSAWMVLLGCGILTIVSTFFFTMRSSLVEYLSVICVSESVALLIFLIIAFDAPFRGGTAVNYDPLLVQLRDMQGASPLPPGVVRTFGVQ